MEIDSHFLGVRDEDGGGDEGGGGIWRKTMKGLNVNIKGQHEGALWR